MTKRAGAEWSRNSLFNKWCWENWTGTCKKMKWYHKLTPYTRINSRCIKDSNINCDTIKVLEKTEDSKISDIPCSHIVTNMSHTARGIKERINICAIIKTWIFYIGKETALIWKQNQPYGNLYLPMIPWTKCLISKM